MLKKTPLKRGNKPLNKATTPLKSNGKTLSRGGGLKTKKKSPEAIKARQELSDKDDEFYTSVWEERPHYCQVCGCYLGEEMSRWFMDHLIEKQLYPEFRHEKENIAVVCVQHHHLRTNGFPHPKHQELIDKAKLKFL